MTTLENIAETAKLLPPDKQEELLEFAELLRQKQVRSGHRRSIGGLCEDLGVHISADDIDRARGELWGTFPRDDV